MTLQELLEAAQLEALGLLDEEEQRTFESAFASAKPGVQIAVRAEQARWAKTPGELISAEPPPALRDRVLSAVGEAMGQGQPAEDLSESRLRQEIIGSIGPSNRLLGAPIAGRVSAGWRAGALGLAAAAAVLLAAFLFVSGQNDDLRVRTQNDLALQNFTQNFGGSFWHQAAFDPATSRNLFDRVDPAASRTKNARVAIFTNPDATRLFAEGLAALSGETYRVVVLNDGDTIGEQIADLGGGGLLISHGIGAKLSNGMRLAIVAAPAGAKVAEDAALLLVATIKLG